MTTLVPPDAFALPPLSALSFVPFIFAQVVLLHPIFPDHISRPLRFLLTFPAVFLSALAPFKWRIEPSHLAIGANFRWGVFGPNFILKSLEWGLAVDRTPYQWIGFEGLGEDGRPKGVERVAETAEGSEDVKAKGSKDDTTSVVSGSIHPDGTRKLAEDDVGEHGDAAVVKAVSSHTAAVKDSPLQVFLSSLHLLTAMRGIGYAFGPPSHSLGPTPPRAPLAFFRSAMLDLIKAHIISTLSLIIIINRQTTLPHLLHNSLLPFLPVESLQPLANTVAYFFVGISLWAQMVIGHAGASLAFFVSTSLLRTILPNSLRPPPFDSREWPPLFNSPAVPRSITVFWSSQWHALFRKPFTSVGFEPVVRSLTPIFGKPIARMGGALAVFLLSGWLHDQALFSARHGLPPLTPPMELSFIDRWGAWIFFISQAVAVALEGMFTRLTGRKVNGGPWAALWSYSWIVGVGLLAGRSWVALGLVRDLPPVQDWGWQRYVLPSVALAPPPLWIKNKLV
ncbi:hypothetical protein T439DRAFT_328032 [Meredithblackwellia eburnea MCA 4105]